MSTGHILAAVTAIAAIVAAFQAHRANVLENELRSYQADAASLSPEIQNDALVLTSVSGNFIPPSSVTVEPIFDTPHIQGEPVPMPLEKAINAETGQVKIDNIIASVCGHTRNTPLCNVHSVKQLIVYFTINGVTDGEIIPVSGT